jgi:hypothetical protein
MPALTARRRLSVHFANLVCASLLRVEKQKGPAGEGGAD